MIRRAVLLVGIVVSAALASGLALQDQIVEGQEYRILQTNGKEIRGTVTEEDGTYVVRYASGITIRVPKNRVAKIVPMEEAAPPAGGRNLPGARGRDAELVRRTISDEEIATILGSEHVDIGPADRIEQVDLRAPLPIDQASVNEMMRMAGPKARFMDDFDHFVLVYTSTPEQARQLGSRLESVYEWNVRYMEILNIPRIHQPEAKLEIFFFGQHKEYENYQTINGWRELGAIGFFMRTNNRSAFFDMMTYPPYAGRIAASKDPQVPYRDRQKIKSELAREVEHKNIEVVQHEAAHHIHFNIGIFPAQGDIPRWMSEGLATMFEVPPSDVGASLGATNHYRLYHLRRQFGEELQNLPPMRTFILNDGMFFQFGFHGYSIGWALNHYMYQKHRDAYAKWMRLLASRDDDLSMRVDVSEKQEQFEEIFGEINDKWVNDFRTFINGIQLRPSVLPPEP